LGALNVRQAFLLLFSAAGLVAGCATRAPITVQQARSAITGLPPDKVQACMGLPAAQKTEGSITLWSYASPAGRRAMLVPSDPSHADFQYTPFSADPVGLGLGLSQGPAANAGCIVNVVFDRGIARAVTYVGPGGHLMVQNDECTPLVSACVH
jgi:hypothetical protein